MTYTTKKTDGDWRVQGLVETVDICRTGPSDEPWHIRLAGEGARTETIGQEATKRAALETVAEMVEGGRLTRGRPVRT